LGVPIRAKDGEWGAPLSLKKGKSHTGGGGGVRRETICKPKKEMNIRDSMPTLGIEGTPNHMKTFFPTANEKKDIASR